MARDPGLDASTVLSGYTKSPRSRTPGSQRGLPARGGAGHLAHSPKHSLRPQPRRGPQPPAGEQPARSPPSSLTSAARRGHPLSHLRSQHRPPGAGGRPLRPHHGRPAPTASPGRGAQPLGEARPAGPVTPGPARAPRSGGLGDSAAPSPWGTRAPVRFWLQRVEDQGPCPGDSGPGLATSAGHGRSPPHAPGPGGAPQPGPRGAHRQAARPPPGQARPRRSPGPASASEGRLGRGPPEGGAGSTHPSAREAGALRRPPPSRPPPRSRSARPRPGPRAPTRSASFPARAPEPGVPA